MPNESVVEHVFRVKDLVGDAPGVDRTGNQSKKGEKNLAQQLKKLAGIDVGLGALLKQSQIFTGYMGNLFAIIGAMIDTILAPLAPTAFKALAALGKKIPAIAKMAEKWMPKLVEYGKNIIGTVDRWMKKISETWSSKFLTVIKWLIAINLGIKLLMMSGRFAVGITGIRGAVGLGSRLLGRGGGAAATTAVAGGTGLMARAGASISGRILGRGGGAAAAATSASGAVGTGAWQGGKWVTSTSTSSGTGLASRFGKYARFGKVASRIPIIGAIASAGFAYAGGRDQGMSVGKSAARGGFSAGGMLAGAAAGAAIGSIVPGPGTILGGIAGGIAGAFGGEMLFDALFGKKGGAGGGGPSNVGVTGGVGLSGYSAPKFIARSFSGLSNSVEKYKIIVDDVAVKHKALALASENAGGSLQGLSEGKGVWADKIAEIEKEQPPPPPLPGEKQLAEMLGGGDGPISTADEDMSQFKPIKPTSLQDVRARQAAAIADSLEQYAQEQEHIDELNRAAQQASGAAALEKAKQFAATTKLAENLKKKAADPTFGVHTPSDIQFSIEQIAAGKKKPTLHTEDMDFGAAGSSSGGWVRSPEILKEIVVLTPMQTSQAPAKAVGGAWEHVSYGWEDDVW